MNLSKLTNNDFIMGMDISSLPEMLDNNKKYYDFEKNEYDPLDLIKSNGVNYIRLRIWNEPKNVPESRGYCDLAQTTAFAKRIKEKGFKLFLDFHYSDWWADPAKQNKPKAWEGLSLDRLTDALYNYTKDVLTTLDEAGAYPDMVQIGNEIRSGMVFPEGTVQNWPGLSLLINAGIKAVRDTNAHHVNKTPVVIHLDQGGRYAYLMDFFDNALAYGVTDFDIIGLSYYPFWHGTFHDFKVTMNKLVDRYNKPLVIAEIAHAWRKPAGEGVMFGKEQEEIAGFSATPENQRKVLEIIMNITANVKNNMGLGTFYWEPLMLPIGKAEGWSYNMSVTDNNGYAGEGLKAYHYSYDASKNKDIVKIYNPPRLYATPGSRINLSDYSKVKVLLFDGSQEYRDVKWETDLCDYEAEEGEYLIKGSVEGTNLISELSIEIGAESKDLYNYVTNTEFSDDFSGYSITADDNVVIKQAFTERYPFPKPPFGHIYFSSPSNFIFDIHQCVEGLKNGVYEFSLDFRGDNTTGVDVSMYAETSAGGTRVEKKIYPSDEDWKEYKIPDIRVAGTSVKLGLYISSPPITGRFGNFRLTRKEQI